MLARGDLAEARSQLYDAIRLRPDYVDALSDLAWMLATASDARVRDAAEALRLAKHAADLTGQRDAGILETLAAAYAEGGQFDDAVRTVEQAIELCDPATEKDLLKTLQEGLQLFRSGRPMHQ